MSEATKCTHKKVYCDKCHDWLCQTDGCPNKGREWVSGLLGGGYKCQTCTSKRCSECGQSWKACNICGDGGCTTSSCSKRRRTKGGWGSPECMTCKNKPNEASAWKGACSCGNWTWTKRDKKKAGCNNSSCHKKLSS